MRKVQGLADKFALACGECGRRNYSIKKNRSREQRLEFKKYCKYCKTHTLHRETK
ncbi:MAG TPA: 50S ribosomal protein L33 [Bacillales bacterium]|nr:50S ribosomal protein L33 [Bacillales bacterium]